MNEKIQKYLIDIQRAIARMEIHLGSNPDFTQYKNSITVKSAVERELGIIGEAMNKILQIQPEIKISFARIIVHLRNRIIHAYDSLNDGVMWKIIVKDIPVLKTEVNELLSDGTTL